MSLGRGLLVGRSSAERGQRATYGRRQVGLKVIGFESIRAIGNFSGAINHHDGREGVDGEEAVEAIGKYDGHEKLVRFQIRLYQRFIFVTIGGEKERIGIGLEISRDASKQRLERMAKSAPARPET